jgi:hypothetical protein
MKKLRARRAPANQAHVTNLKESPALLAADAAEAARRGFAEIETTVGVARYAPLNALALLVGSQTGRHGVMTQCAVEERRNLELAIRGLVTYAETLSVYGTEPVFVDGDDTPWSKAFLGAAYASRGVKVRFTSGTGSEALMGQAEGMSMLYLEARCVSVVRAAGAQGVQNGSISCVALVLAVPGGTRAILAEREKAPPQDCRPRDAAVVADDVEELEVLGHRRPQPVPLVVADLDQQTDAGPQAAGRGQQTGEDAASRVLGEERQPGLERADVGGGGGVGGIDVGRSARASATGSSGRARRLASDRPRTWPRSRWASRDGCSTAVPARRRRA